MADAVMNYVVKKFGDLILREAANLHGANDQLEWLKRQHRRMQCFLKDADAKSQGDDERVKNWVIDVRDLAYEVEKVIDTCMNIDLRDSIGLITWRIKVHKSVQGIRDKMLELSQSKTLYGIADIGETMGTTSQSIHMPPILPQLNDDDIDKFGFDEEKKMIVQQLVDTSNTNRSVIAIVDIDGLGKVALVEAIYNDPEVKTSFDLVVWITISQKYTIIEILQNILSRVSGISSMDAIEILAVTLINELKKYKYLIILVDVWEENVWDQLQNFFPDVNNGSRVIITTRFSNVSSSMHFRGKSVYPGTKYTQAVSSSLQAAPTSLNMPDSTPERRVLTCQTSHVSTRTRPHCAYCQPIHISQTFPVIPRTSLSIPITEEILKSSNELMKKSSIISVISGQTSLEHLQAELPVALDLSQGDRKVSPFGINTFVISFHSEKEARTAESMDPILLDGPHGPCTVSLDPWSLEFGSMRTVTGSYRRITIVNLPLHCRDWATLVEAVKPAGDLVAVYKDDKVTLEFVYVMVRLRRVIHLPLELELTVDTTQYLIHLEDSQTFQPYNSGRSTMEITLQKQGPEGHVQLGPTRSTHEIPRKEKGKMLPGDGDDI
ncbi:uncharacterized protein LOC120257109 [Dioscorea cayenensis subsp. rotundata]|uniref:Uncharacterized protein LOC120257109 n=1 Tax=Dioscorea cayennensis subsp. rotundata TaxID=55577 RepID=A0AB40B0T9_DIOCR|nr:uncharacterized protein LOC120257109 [Dioscorea cayenensis subsp. rotundata]